MCEGGCVTDGECCDAADCGAGDWSCSGARRCECDGRVCDGACRQSAECCSASDCGVGDWTCSAAGTCGCGCTECDGVCYGTAPCCEFGDVPVAHTAHDEIVAICDAGITHGCSDGVEYCVDDPVIRDHMAVFIINALGETPSPADDTAYFDDIAGLWTAPYINRIFELGIVNGCGPRLYCPGDVVTRRTASVFLINALGETRSAAATNAYFDDLGPDDSTTPYINRLSELGIAEGCSTRLYCPNNTLLRYELALFLARAFLCF